MMQSSSPVARKVVVIGLDGATPEWVFPWIEEGRLPNLARLMHNAARGPIDSTMPPFTQMAWPVFYSGYNPGKTGMFTYFDNINAPNRGPATGSALRVKPIWRVLNEHGKRTIVVAVPVSYPPEAINGVMISGMDTPDESAPFTYPAELRQTLIEQNYKIFPDRTLGYGGNTEALYDYCLQVSTTKTRVFTQLLREEAWDFAMIVLNEIDVVSHFITGDRVRDFYEDTDKLVGEILDVLDEDTVVLVISDHGVKPVKGRLFVNEILKDLGLLHLKAAPAASSLLGRIGLTRDTVRKLIKRLGIGPLLRRRAARSFAFVRDQLPTTTHRERADIDMSRTKVYLDSGYWLRLTGKEPLTADEFDRLRDALAPYNCELHRGQDLYAGPYLGKAPDYVAFTPDYMIASAVGTGAWTGPVTVRPGDHSFHATAILSGDPSLVRAGEIRGRLVDWTPTLLYLLGIAPPSDMDGQVLTDAIAPDTLAARPVSSRAASVQDELRARIRQLKARERV
jgi:predicted AlkP superfamily phosphohydrolase/phosphomutase